MEEDKVILSPAEFAALKRYKDSSDSYWSALWEIVVYTTFDSTGLRQATRDMIREIREREAGSINSPQG